MYDDARAAGYLDRIVRADPERWSAAMQPTWALPKILWLLERQTGQIAHKRRCRRRPSDRWPGRHGQTSHALKSGYDLIADGWPVDAFDGLASQLSCFPR